MRRRSLFPAAALTVLLCAAAAFAGTAQEARVVDPAGVQALTNAGAAVNVHPATGAARFVRLAATGVSPAGPGATPQAQTDAFLAAYRSVFGLQDLSRELSFQEAKTDTIGFTHVTYRQMYEGVPVFAGILKGHVDAANRLRVVNGTIIPDISLDARPSRTSEEAARVALDRVRAGRDETAATAIRAQSSQLYVFRAGLVQGIPGPNHLVWEVVVGNGGDVREFVYIDAHTNKWVDQYTGVYDALNRRAYDGANSTVEPGPNYPGSPFWVEGQAFPTGTAEADNMLLASQETYNYFQRGFGRDSFNAAGATLDSIFNRGWGCLNASWNGTYISFCPGLTVDDVTAHEWTHAYTEYTHGLIYQWQSGALNEAYSDIFGEAVDLTNGRGLDTPNTPRTAGACSTYSPFAPRLRVTAPPAIAANYVAVAAAFGPAVSGQAAPVVLVVDGTGGLSTACTAAGGIGNPGAIAGNVAMIDRGTCTFVEKVANAQAAGAIGVVVVNNVAGAAIVMGGTLASTIPAIMISLADGNTIKPYLGGGVSGVMEADQTVPPDNSYRWLVSEEVNVTGWVGAIRDMWAPTCYGNPGKVSDPSYVCTTGDGGGVHSNSGVPNHAFALIVDGGTYNGQTIAAVGLVKASHIYFRAMAVYQVPSSGFSEHADALDASCTDLIGINLADPTTGAPSGQLISAADCAQVAKAALAVQLRTPPTQCNFVPMLALHAPALCPSGTRISTIYADTFEADPTATWVRTHTAVTPGDFTPRDWAWVSHLPDGRAGSGFFGTDPNIGTCLPGGDQSGVLHLQSPAFTVPVAAVPKLAFDHNASMELGYDGGNLRISVNSGPFALVPGANFTFNTYNTTLNAAPGNTNPQAGQQAFSGADGGSTSGSWGQSQVNLSTLAVPGDSVRLRWDVGTDGCSGWTGWYLDNVKVYTCTADSDLIFTDGFESGPFTGPGKTPPAVAEATATPY